MKFLKCFNFSPHYLHQHYIEIILLCIKSIDLDENCWLTLKWALCHKRVRSYTVWKFPRRGRLYTRRLSLPLPLAWSGTPPERPWWIFISSAIEWHQFSLATFNTSEIIKPNLIKWFCYTQVFIPYPKYCSEFKDVFTSKEEEELLIV
jgi:hypothetical protein